MSFREIYTLLMLAILYIIFFRVPENMITFGDPSETEMLDWRPFGDLDMPHRRPRCPIGVQFKHISTYIFK